MPRFQQIRTRREKSLGHELAVQVAMQLLSEGKDILLIAAVVLLIDVLRMGDTQSRMRNGAWPPNFFGRGPKDFSPLIGDTPF